LITNIRLHGFLSERWNKKNISSFIRGFCLINILLFSYRIGSVISDYRNFSVPSPHTIINEKSEKVKRILTLSEYQFIILNRNIFSNRKIPTAVHKINTLPLRLVGIHYNSKDKKRRFAILEDRRNGQQDVFEINDVAFEMAEIVSIEIYYIDVVNNNIRYRLRLDEGLSEVTEELEKIEKELVASPYKKNKRKGITETSFRNYEIDRVLVKEVLDDLKSHLSTGNSKLHEDGILVYGFRQNSIFREIGLADSDIITSVNGKPITSFLGATELFAEFMTEDLDELDLVVITVKRAGQEIPLHYRLVK